MSEAASNQAVQEGKRRLRDFLESSDTGRQAIAMSASGSGGAGDEYEMSDVQRKGTSSSRTTGEGDDLWACLVCPCHYVQLSSLAGRWRRVLYTSQCVYLRIVSTSSKPGNTPFAGLFFPLLHSFASFLPFFLFAGGICSGAVLLMLSGLFQCYPHCVFFHSVFNLFTAGDSGLLNQALLPLIYSYILQFLFTLHWFLLCPFSHPIALKELQFAIHYHFQQQTTLKMAAFQQLPFAMLLHPLATNTGCLHPLFPEGSSLIKHFIITHRTLMHTRMKKLTDLWRRAMRVWRNNSHEPKTLIWWKLSLYPAKGSFCSVFLSFKVIH